MGEESSDEDTMNMVQVRTQVSSSHKHILKGLMAAAAVSVLLAGCASPDTGLKTKFSSAKYGVKASPKVVADGQAVPKGGGRYIVGKKYKVAGKWYYPKEDPNYSKIGIASWYGPNFHGRRTANGEVFDMSSLTAAHPTMPLPSYARVTNLTNGRSMIVRVNDRGPFDSNRIIDLSERVATMLGTKREGVAKVKVQYVGPARLDGHDTAFLMASYRGPGAVQPGGTMPGTMLAQADTPTEASAHVSSTPRHESLSGSEVASTGGIAVPPARPYRSDEAVAAAQVASAAPQQVAYDPAVAFDASQQTVQVASLNSFHQPVIQPTSAPVAPQPTSAPVSATATSSNSAPSPVPSPYDASNEENGASTPSITSLGSGSSTPSRESLQPKILGQLRIPAAYAEPERHESNIPFPGTAHGVTRGSAVSSYQAQTRIDTAYSAFSSTAKSDRLLRKLAED